jgi:hypothetical protein
MLDAELATMHGYANVTVKGHADRRRRDWQKLAAKFSEMGAPVQQGGERLVN